MLRTTGIYNQLSSTRPQNNSLLHTDGTPGVTEVRDDTRGEQELIKALVKD